MSLFCYFNDNCKRKKIAPYLIFKGKSNGEIENKLKKGINVINKRCYLACNENAWSTEKIIKDFHLKIQDNYLINSDLINDDNEGF